MRLRLLALLVLPLTAAAATDQACMSNCLARGYMYQYCQSQCSYEVQAPQPRRIDYACMSNCTSKGYQYQYCQAVCSY